MAAKYRELRKKVPEEWLVLNFLWVTVFGESNTIGPFCQKDAYLKRHGVKVALPNTQKQREDAKLVRQEMWPK